MKKTTKNASAKKAAPKKSATKKPAAKPKAKPSAKPKRKARGQTELTQVVVRLEAVAEKLAWASDQITRATAAGPPTGKPQGGPPTGEPEENTFKTLLESSDRIESAPVLVRHTRSE